MLLFDIFRFSFQRFFAYPAEILAEVIRMIIEMFFLIYFWSLVIQHTSQNISLSSIISYFLIATGIKEIVMAQWGDFGGLLGRLIRTGEISNYLVKPVNPLEVLYATAVGRTGLTWITSFLMIILGISINPPRNLVSLFLFLLFFVIAWTVCYSYNIIEGTIFFYVPDGRGIRGSIGHIIGIFSGMLIPLYFFPSWLYTIIRFTPFPSMVYLPTHALTIETVSPDVVLTILTGGFWAIAMWVISRLFWRKSMKFYEATGM